jgi:hypothetical protein
MRSRRQLAWTHKRSLLQPLDFRDVAGPGHPPRPAYPFGVSADTAGLTTYQLFSPIAVAVGEANGDSP